MASIECKKCGHIKHFAGQCVAPCLCTSGRIEHDAWFTPQPAANAIVKAVLPLCYVNASTLRVLEPYCGHGAFIRAVREQEPDAIINAIDIQDFRTEALAAGASQFAQRNIFDAPPKQRYDLVISNPPFELVEHHVRLCLSLLAPSGICTLLMQAAFMHTQDRVDNFWTPLQSADTRLYRYMPLRERLSFETPTVPNMQKTGTANTEYVVFVFQNGYTGVASILPHIRMNA